ncbi:hypothetical protein AMJ52_09240 [candidate division TA06 bacterium DG_78]|uniref:Zinc chelation protein SecC n=1 Tax=candidate division TA06 bacterium DG_78 TaxID=1703772 RepID=A0A0S7YA41_UNCT6|nr:MAG: hypothetical protein AMJ52_09240 [candidate division TA06 bacterium DG_78]
MHKDYLTMFEDLLNKYNAMGDDELCLCGSGKPFKNCHKLKDIQERVDLYNLQKEVLKIFTTKTCYFQDEKCSKTKTASHSIPKTSLKTISKNNHVLRFMSLNVAELSKLDALDQMPPTDIGINEVGSFYGFCSHHDNLLFSPIEKECFEPTPQQDCLLLFRALCKELYTSTGVTKTIPIHHKLIESKGNIEYKHLLNVENILLFLCRHKCIFEMLNDYNQLVSDIKNKSFNGYSSITIVTEQPLPINCCSYVNPAFSLDGSVYQDYNDLSVDLESFSFTAFTSGNNGFFHLCWSNKTNFAKFFSPLFDIKKDQLADFFIQMVFAYSENHAFNKDWWEGLHIQKRDHLIKIFFSDIINQPVRSNPVDDFFSMKFSDLNIVDIKKH